MRILFDQGTPAPLRHALAGHSVETAYERGWSNPSNGALLNAAEDASFDLFVTTDQNLRYQQDLAGRPARHPCATHHSLADHPAAYPGNRGCHRRDSTREFCELEW